jgi:cytochrome P450
MNVLVSMSFWFTDGGVAEECFARPNEFIPERWIERTELVKEKDAFAPFSLGKCVLH